MPTPKDFFAKLEFLRYVKAPILVGCLIWSTALVIFLLAIAANDVARTDKLQEAAFLLGVGSTMLGAGLVILLYQIRRLNKKLKVVADLLQEMNGVEPVQDKTEN